MTLSADTIAHIRHRMQTELPEEYARLTRQTMPTLTGPPPDWLWEREPLRYVTSAVRKTELPRPAASDFEENAQ